MSALATAIKLPLPLARAPDAVKRLEGIEDLLYMHLDIARRRRLEMERLERAHNDTGPDYYLVLRERNDAMESAREHLSTLRRAGFPLSPIVQQLGRFEGVDR